MNNSPGIDAFSFRFSKWSVSEVIAQTSTLGLSSVSIDMVDQKDLTEETVSDVAVLAKKMSIEIYLAGPALVPSNHNKEGAFEKQVGIFQKCIRFAHILGTPVVRTYILDTDSPMVGLEQGFEISKKVLDQILPDLKQSNIKLAIENHRDYRSSDLRKFIEKINMQNVGVCFDFGNQIPLIEDPLTAYQNLHEYLLMVHLKDVALKWEDDGFWWRSVPLGMGSLPIEHLRERIKKDGIQNLFLEISTSRSATFTEVPINLQNSDNVVKSFKKFVDKYQNWPKEIEKFLTRDNASTEEIARQDLEHVKTSLQWYQSHCK